ncbi:Purine trans deoxyribosylase (Nucleoside deoxyribosyltransferase-I) [Lactiplantibacillus plantarum]|nr:Purine trans deoxyribosylase (Nucleoside deoxyribosyltransferase-I) [Lactiplantibacillus plantarum]
MAQIYIASPFFSPEQVTRVTQLEEALAKNPTVTDFYSPARFIIKLAKYF